MSGNSRLDLAALFALTAAMVPPGGFTKGPMRRTEPVAPKTVDIDQQERYTAKHRAKLLRRLQRTRK